MSSICPEIRRQVQKKLGPAWTSRGRPPTSYVTKCLTEDWLRGEQDGAIFQTAAFTGLRMGELLALRWRDVVRYSRRPATTAYAEPSSYLAGASGANEDPSAFRRGPSTSLALCANG